jgi:GR25 family glycosyltransferase involved in LPS biosynthesis
MKTLVLTCPELDNGKRQSLFKKSRFPNVQFVTGMSKHCISDSYNIATNNFNYGYGDGVWDPGAVAVAYGHLKVWKRIIELGQICLVLEDDALPLPLLVFDYFKLDQVVATESFPEKWILTLWQRGIDFCEEFNDRYFEVTASYGNSGLVGYVLGPDIAEILVDNFSNIDCPVDQYLLGIGFSESPRYTVLAPRRNLIEHRYGPSLRDG